MIELALRFRPEFPSTQLRNTDPQSDPMQYRQEWSSEREEFNC